MHSHACSVSKFISQAGGLIHKPTKYSMDVTMDQSLDWELSVEAMSSSDLASIPHVEIDPNGRFKYVLAKVYTSTNAGDDDFQYFVRGFQWGAFHADIFEKFEAQIAALGLSAECVGGGRIMHHADAKKLEVFGYSQGYGRADHSITADLLKKKYPDYDITTSDEGY